MATCFFSQIFTANLTAIKNSLKLLQSNVQMLYFQKKIVNTCAFPAAHDGTELALVRFELENLLNITQELL